MNCALVGYYVAGGANSLLAFLDNLSFPSSRVKKPKKTYYLLQNPSLIRSMATK